MITFDYAKSELDQRLDYVDKTATNFFDLENNNDKKQIDANFETTKHAFEIGAITAILMDDNNPVGWGFAIPTLKTLMNKFLINEITEYELFWKTEKNNEYDSIYFCAIFIDPKYRSLKNTLKLIRKTIDPLIKKDIIIFYDAYSDRGKKIGYFIRTHSSKYPIFSK